MNWDRDGRDWPNRERSRFVTAGGLRWHVQVGGTGPAVLLIHGTGASTHSFRDLIPLLTPDFTVVAPDLPGHGFTATPATAVGFTLPNVATGIGALLADLGIQPAVVAGHSAGAAVAIRMVLDGSIHPDAVVSLNGALLPFAGFSNNFFGPAFRFVASSRLAAKFVAGFAGSGSSVERLLRSTGSRIDPRGTHLYARLTANDRHVHGALALMANWDLHPLVHDLPRLPARLVLVTGSQDGMVPPGQAYRVRGIFPKAELVPMRGLGHLAHEERPGEIAQLLRRLAEPHG